MVLVETLKTLNHKSVGCRPADINTDWGSTDLQSCNPESPTPLQLRNAP